MTSVQAWSALRVSADGVKENAAGRLGLSGAALVALSACWALALLVALRQDAALPPPLSRDAPPAAFSAARAAAHLRNLTALGPRVCGSYENEVLAVSSVTAALRALQPAADAAGVSLDIDLQRADGAFAITFLDGMSNVYRGAQSVAARLSAAGGGAREAVLVNCHYDTVPDSPGAADDAAGCAVLLEAARTLLARGAGRWRRDLLLLLNGAEENIMQASHAFVTAHAWARRARAAVNLEACGAGGRELLFRAARAARLLPLYAAAPRPYGSSLAHEVFDSGLVPGDTDFRIFRDFGDMAGLDLAWSADGYAYHTALDAAERVPLAALQHTGENLLAILSGMLELESDLVEAEDSEPVGVYFDVLGLFMVSLSARSALLTAAAALLLCATRLQRSARAAAHLLVSRGAWWRLVCRVSLRLLTSALSGLAAALLLALTLHAARYRLSWYARPWLLAPLYGAPALAAAAYTGSVLLRDVTGSLPRWWRARATCDALTLLWAAALVACVALRLRSGFVPALWTIALAVAGLLPSSLRAAATERVWWWWSLCALGPAVQTWYLSVCALRLLAPVAGRAGDNAPPDALLAALSAAAALCAASALLALLPAASGGSVRRALVLLCACCAGAVLTAVVLSRSHAPYTPLRPQRVMLFHLRRTTHTRLTPDAGAGEPGPLAGGEELLYWIPSLDVNMPQSLYQHVPAMSSAREMSSVECATRLYCGAPYYLPVLSLVPRAHYIPSAQPPSVRLLVSVHLKEVDQYTGRLYFNLTGPAHIVVIVSPARGARLTHTSLLQRAQAGPRWGTRDTYLIALGAPGGRGRPVTWDFTITLQKDSADGADKDGGEGWASLSLAGHAMFGAEQRAPEHDTLRDSFPDWTQVTGWGVDLHLIDV